MRVVSFFLQSQTHNHQIFSNKRWKLCYTTTKLRLGKRKCFKLSLTLWFSEQWTNVEREQGLRGKPLYVYIACKKNNYWSGPCTMLNNDLKIWKKNPVKICKLTRQETFHGASEVVIKRFIIFIGSENFQSMAATLFFFVCLFCMFILATTLWICAFNTIFITYKMY